MCILCMVSFALFVGVLFTGPMDHDLLPVLFYRRRLLPLLHRIMDICPSSNKHLPSSASLAPCLRQPVVFSHMDLERSGLYCGLLQLSFYDMSYSLATGCCINACDSCSFPLRCWQPAGTWYWWCSGSLLSKRSLTQHPWTPASAAKLLHSCCCSLCLAI